MLPHPYAELFPMMDKKALQELVASIRDDGLEKPIVTFEGKILDGRNRSLACSNARVKKEYVEYKGDDALGYVIRSNLVRRHLTTSQRAMVASNLASLELGDNQYTKEGAGIQAPSQSKAAELLNVSRDSVQRAKQVYDSGNEEVIEAVRSGEMSVNKAVQQVRESEDVGHAPARETVSQAEIECRRLLKLWDNTGQEAHALFFEALGVIP
jgi:ParB-like chromosome segregation protein Spo0J